MSITSATYTTNSTLITVSGETTPANIISAVDTAITTLGWTQYDVIQPNAATAINYFSSAASTTGTVALIGPLVIGTTTFTLSGTAYTTSSASWTGITQTSTSGVGYGAIFSVSKSSTGTTPYSGTTTVTITNAGTGYAIGDTITIAGNYLSGSSPTNDLVLTVGTSVASGSGPWTARIMGMSTTTNFSMGQSLTATAGTGTLFGGSPTSVVINNIPSSTAITYTVNGGTTPTAGTVTNISIPSVANTWSPIYTYVYRSLCADNTNYKYLIIRWDPTKQQFYTSAAEGWSTSTHLPTNETYGFNGTFGHGYDLKDCQIIVSATNRHFVIWPWIRQSMGLWSGVFEFERIAPEDTAAAGNPCFAWTNSIILGYNTDNGYTPFVFPRIPYGTNTLGYMRPVTSKGMTSSTTQLGDAYNYTYGWDATKSLISSISIDHYSVLMQFGRAYNLSITKSFGAGLDTTTIPLASGGWADTSGTNATCLILPLQGGFESNASSSSNTVNVAGRPQNNGYSATGVVDMVLIGVNAWCACGIDGIKTYNTTQTVPSGTLTVRLAGNYDKLIFDGFRTIYAIYVNAGTGGTTLARIDTETYNSSTITLAYAAHSLAIDGKNVYVGMNGNTTQPRVAIITRWETSDGSTGTGFTLANTYTTAVLPNASWIANIFPDYRGNIYVIYSNSATFNRTQSGNSPTNIYNPYSYLSIYYGICLIDKISITSTPTLAYLAPTRTFSTVGSSYAPIHSIGFYFDQISSFFVSLQTQINLSPAYARYSSYYLYNVMVVTSFSTNTLTLTLLNSTALAGNGSYSSLLDYSQATVGYFSAASSSYDTTTYGILQNVTPYKGMLIFNIQPYYNVSTTPQYSTLYWADLFYSVGGNTVIDSYKTANSQFVTGNYDASAITGTRNNYQYKEIYTQGTTALKNIGGSVYYLKNLYDMNSTAGATTGRIILKG